MKKLNKTNIKDSLGGTLNGKEVCTLFGEDSLPRGFNKNEDGSPMRTTLPSRARALASLYRWAIPAIRDAIDIDLPVSYKVAVVVKPGHGSTTLSRTFFSILRDYIVTDNSINSKIDVIIGNKSGLMASASSAQTNSQELIISQVNAIVIMDGLPPQDNMDAQQKDALKRSMVFAFVTSEQEANKYFGEDLIIIKIPQLTNTEVLQIAQMRNYISEKNTSKQGKLIQDINNLLDKGVAPRTILNFLSVSNGIRYSNPTSVEDLFNIENGFEQITNTYSNLNTFEHIPTEQLTTFMKRKVFGQDIAIQLLVETIAMIRYGLVSSDRPVISAMFLGQTGVGKTHIARVLSEALFGREDIVRIDMSEYDQPHSTSKLFGSDPGFVGYGSDTPLVREISKRSKGIILLDEIEKAHKSVHNGLLPLLDYGKFTTGDGKVIDATGYIIIMTSNALVDEVYNNKQLGFKDNTASEHTNSGALRRKLTTNGYFSPEFVNRVDVMVGFNNLDDKVCRMISKEMFTEMTDNLSKRGFNLEISKDYMDNLIKQREMEFGGRSIKRLVDNAKRQIVRIISANPDNKNINLSMDAISKTSSSMDW